MPGGGAGPGLDLLPRGKAVDLGPGTRLAFSLASAIPLPERRE